MRIIKETKKMRKEWDGKEGYRIKGWTVISDTRTGKNIFDTKAQAENKINVMLSYNPPLDFAILEDIHGHEFLIVQRLKTKHEGTFNYL